MSNRKQLTIDEGIMIQQIHLKEWRSVLSADAYHRLVTLATRDNNTATSGYDIVRGQMLDEIIHNKLIKK
jgi:hypothetical protein